MSLVFLDCGPGRAPHRQSIGRSFPELPFPVLSACPQTKTEKRGKIICVKRNTSAISLFVFFISLSWTQLNSKTTSMKSLSSAVLSWYRDIPLKTTCMEAPCSSTGWVLSCQISVLMTGFSDLNRNSTRWVSPGRMTPTGNRKQQGKQKARLSDGSIDKRCMTYKCWRQVFGSCLCGYQRRH